ncbi:hypothetical protein BH10ACT3_BH10ACT3_11080 [soil metagenome]
MGRVYIHEFVDVIGTERARYQHHMTANWSPEAGPLRRQRCFGVFSVVGSTGRWPQVVNLWEYDSWDDLAHNFQVELVGAGHRDPMLSEWWAKAAEFRTGGLDRILVADETSPGIEQWCEQGGTGAVAYLHETIRTAPGHAREVCSSMVGPVVSELAPYGLRLVGAFRTAMRAEDEVIVLWAVPDWETWGRYEAAVDDPDRPLTQPWGHGSAGVRGIERILLVDAELSPLRTGRQPRIEDRRSLDEL